MSSKNFFSNLYRVFKWLIILGPIIGLGYLIYLDFSPSGHLVFNYDFTQRSPAITELFPANRLTAISDLSGKQVGAAINKEPVYFDVRLPQKFARARVSLTFKDPGAKLIQLGLRTIGNSDWNYLFKPIKNEYLDKITWPKLVNDQVTVWQRQKTFLSISDFFNHLSQLNKLAALNYPLGRHFILADYRSQTSVQSINKSIRGAHSFYTYIKNEPLDFKFVIQDINRTAGPDVLKIKAFNQANKLISQQKIDDDGLITKFGPATAKREIKLYLENLPEGVYRIDLDCEDDIFFRAISTRQQYFTFIDHIYLVDNPEYSDGFLDLKYQPTSVYSTLSRVGLYTAHPEGLQSVAFGKNKLTLTETHKNYYFSPSQTPIIIYVPKNDLKIFGRGLLALSAKQFFNPEVYDLRDFSETPDIDYLISDYQTPELDNGWLKSTVKFDLMAADIQNRKLRFVISDPELNTDQQPILLKNIQVELVTDPLSWSDLWLKIKSYLSQKL